MGDTRPARRWPFAVALLLILLVAAGLRLYRLPELPLGLHYDEAANGILAGEIAQGIETPIFIPSYTGKEVLFFYWTAVWMKLLGMTPLALRLSSALVGLATVVATAWAVRELLYGRRDANWIALLTAAFLATSFWHLILSRYGFRAVTQPLMQALTVGALWRGLRPSTPPLRLGVTKGGLPWLLLAGLFCGLTVYTYTSARVFPIPLAAALLSLLITDRGRRRARLGQLAIFTTAAALTLAPLAYYWLTHPGSFLIRVEQVAITTWTEAWSGFLDALGMFFIRGDPNIRFNLPHRPLFDPVTAALFLVGLAVAIWKFIHPSRSATPLSAPLHLASCIFLLTCLPIMLLPSALASGEITPNHLRAVGLLPFVYLFPALGLWTILDSLHRLLTHKSQSTLRNLLLPASCLLLLAVLGFVTASVYFNQWATSAELYYVADGDLVEVAAYLNQSDLAETIPYVASFHYRHPTLAFLAKDYEGIRWLTGGSTLAFPAKGEGLLIFPRSASGDLAWVQSMLQSDTLVAAPLGPDGAPAFYVYRTGPVLSAAEGPAPNPTPTQPLTADLAHVALLLGYDVIGEPRSGATTEVAVWWRVLTTPDRGDYGPVARLTDPWDFTWGETQPFHYPSVHWAPGETIVDHLSIPVAPGAPPGDYAVRFSLYSASADSLLPVLDDAGRYAGTTVELPLRLARAATPPHPDDLGIRTRLDARADGLALLGVNLDTSSARPGERLHLTLFWQADEQSLPNYDVTLTLGDATLYTGVPVHGTYPTSAWAADEIVADRYDPRLPRDVLPGDYPLRLRVSDLTLDLGTIAVQAAERTFDAPPISHPLAAALGDRVQLLGYDLSTDVVAPGDTLTLTLYWRALTEMDESYTVFTHLLAPDGSMTGQRDNPPVGGTYPTSMWLAGEVVADAYEIPVRADATPGAHRLEVGMYVAETGARLPIADAQKDAILLQEVTVTGP